MMGHYTAYLKTVREPPRAARFQVSTSHSMSTTHIKPPLDNPEDMFDSMSSHAGGRSHRHVNLQGAVHYNADVIIRRVNPVTKNIAPIVTSMVSLAISRFKISYLSSFSNPSTAIR